MKKKIINSIYKLVSDRDEFLYEMYKILDKDDKEFIKTSKGENISKILLDFALRLKLQLTDGVKLALLNRLITLREDDLIKIFEASSKTKSEINELRKIAYNFTELFQMNIQKDLLSKIVNLDMPKFYKELFNGVFEIGKKMNNLNKVWDNYLLLELNPMLGREIKGNVREYLVKNNLMEIDSRTNSIADRAYSVLVKENGTYKSLPYALAFQNEVKCVVMEILRLVVKLLKSQKTKSDKLWINYLLSLSQAFEEVDNNKLIEKWAKVDEDWMKIDSPIQIGHPLEYYEDKYRNAVAMEFDLRIDNLEKSKNNKRIDSVQPMFNTIFNQILANNKKLNLEVVNSIKTISDANLKKVQIHIGKQAFYFGSTLNGLSSAQIVPNDEIVSEKEGKKIFAFAEKSISLNRAKPSLLINRKILGTSILDKYNDLLFNREDDYLEVYDILTIGHEYGHALFKNELAEVRMNDTGNYKNIEEFKASAGGLVAFFHSLNEELWEDVLINTVMRAIKLIAWQRDTDVEAYYCEGLITLKLLFEAEIFKFKDNELVIDISFSKYLEFQELYIIVYKDLATHYLSLLDASLFLKNFCERNENGYFLPKVNNGSTEVLDFVNYYYALNEDIGREVDSEYKFKKNG